MAKDQEDKPGIISLNDYQEELELEVQYHTARVMATNPFRVNKKYKHIEIPDFKPTEAREQLDWEVEEFRRCKQGYDGLVGRYYFYFNHCRIKHKKRGKIRPDFRAIQLASSQFRERILHTPGKGGVTIKRRQYGASWEFSGDNVYDCSFNKHFDIGMNSKSETDSRNLFTKHKYIHRNVTPFLRAKVSIDRRDAMIFGKWNKKKERWEGNESSIISVAPTATGHTGNQYRKMVIDEGGEQVDLMALWSNSEDCLMQETERVGTPFIFGTMGDTTKAGRGLMEFWLRNEQYNLERFGIYGYNALIMDDLGNDMIEDSIRWILYERKKKEGGAQIVFNKFQQKYPLDDADAFLTVQGAGVGNPRLLQKRYQQLLENPVQQVKGWMRPKAGGGSDFVPDPQGKIIVYERPVIITNGYVAATDPVEDDLVEKTRDTSNLSTAIMARPVGLQPPRIVLEYTDRPNILADYYIQVALALEWYNHTQVLIEMNKGGWRMTDWFEQHFPKLIAWSPKSGNSVRGGYELRKGIKMSVDRKTQMMGLLDAHIENYWESLPSLRFIDECRVFGADHQDDDFATAVGWCLCLLQSDRRVAEISNAASANNPKSYYKKIGNVIYLMVDGKPIGNITRKIQNPLFNR